MDSLFMVRLQFLFIILKHYFILNYFSLCFCCTSDTPDLPTSFVQRLCLRNWGFLVSIRKWRSCIPKFWFLFWRTFNVLLFFLLILDASTLYVGCWILAFLLGLYLVFLIWSCFELRWSFSQFLEGFNWIRLKHFFLIINCFYKI